MITLAALEEVTDRSRVAPRIEVMLPVGVRARQLTARTLLAGMCLAMADGRPAHLTRVHQALTALGDDDKRRRGVIADWKDGLHLLTCRQTERTLCAASTREAQLDGKWLLRTNDHTLAPEDLAAAYKQLIAVERGWRDMKGALRLRPVFHYREDRIRAYVQLCWLALLLIRVTENAAGDTWRNICHELDRMHLVTLATADGRAAQRSVTTAGQQTILRALDLPEPPKFLDFAPA